MRETSAQVEQRYLGYFTETSTKLSNYFRAAVLCIISLHVLAGGMVPAGSPWVIHIPFTLLLAAALDICQYAYKSAIWQWHCFRINNNSKHRAYWWTNFPTSFFFYAKVALLVTYILGI